MADEITDSQGNVWQSEDSMRDAAIIVREVDASNTYYNSGTIESTGTVPEEVYQNSRYGDEVEYTIKNF